MWTYIIVALVIVVLVAYVWARQIRHKDAGTGKPMSRDDLLAQRGQYWGHGGGYGGA